MSLIDDKYQDTEKLRQASEKLHSLGYKCEDIVDNTRLEIYTKTPPSCVLVYSNEYCGSTADYVNVSLSRSIIERFMLQIPRFEHFQSGVWLLPAGPLRLHQPEEAGGGSAEAGREGRLPGHQVAARGCSQTSHSATRSGVDAIKGGPDSVTGEYELSLRSGESILATNVLIATGAYINISGILREFTESDVDLTLTTQTVAFIRISDSEATVRSSPLTCPSTACCRG